MLSKSLVWTIRVVKLGIFFENYVKVVFSQYKDLIETLLAN
jgi:hypothetical protein